MNEIFSVYLLCVSILHVDGFNLEQRLPKEISEPSGSIDEFFGYTFAVKSPSTKADPQIK